MFDLSVMDIVIDMARSCRNGEVPVAAAVVLDETIISAATNEVETSDIPWHHAEFLAVEGALKKLGSRYLEMASLYVTLEPCAFCAAVLEKVRIKNIYFGAYDPKFGAICHNIRLFEHSFIRPNVVGGIREELCSNILKEFFKMLRIKEDL
ncbi:MAG: nucleoside deaminase [Holosporales bacterium]|jgi:tRNA(Arg) A34 adenosine deaminase TadA|nr:nucleoside deaminase [Holosporales bacterium]